MYVVTYGIVVKMPSMYRSRSLIERPPVTLVDSDRRMRSFYWPEIQ